MLPCSRARAAVSPAHLARQKSTVAALIAPRTRRGPPPAPPAELASPSSKNLFARVRQNIARSHEVTRDATPAKANVFNVALANMRSALKQYDYERAEQHWRQLQAHDLVHYLGPSQLHQLSKYLVMHQKNMTAKRLQPQRRHDLFKEVAVIAAAGGAPDALRAYMQYAVRDNQPQLILEVYEQYLSATAANKPVDLPEDEEEEMKDHNGVDLAGVSLDPATFDRVQFLLFAVTAHAMLGDFHAALRLYVNYPSSIPRQSVNTFLQNTVGNARSAQMREVLHNLDAARLIKHPKNMAGRLMSFVRTKGYKQVQALYDRIVEGMSGPDAFIASEESLISELRPVAMTEYLWTNFVTTFIRCGRKDLAQSVWQNMLSLGMRPGLFVYTAMLDTYADTGAVDDLTQLWNTIVQAKLQPDALGYRALVDGLMKAGRLQEALERYEEFKRTQLPEAPPERAITVFNTMLHELLLSRSPNVASDVFKDMVQLGIKPDQVTFNTFLAYYARREDMTGLSNTIQAMRAAGLYGDEFTYTSILTALIRVGRKDAADLVHGIMTSLKLKPSAHMYTSLITRQLREGTEANLEAAYRLLHLMETTPGLAPSVVTYTAILAGLHRGDWLDEEERQRRRDDIMHRMAARGLQLTRVTYHILIKACLDQEECLLDAVIYFREMLARNLVTSDAWYLILSGVAHWERWDVGDELIRDMQARRAEVLPSDGVGTRKGDRYDI
ncbi:hypothetical protein EV715DRAFT_250103 [Schizophyllum commune]